MMMLEMYGALHVKRTRASKAKPMMGVPKQDCKPETVIKYCAMIWNDYLDHDHKRKIAAGLACRGSTFVPRPLMTSVANVPSSASG